MTEGLKSAHNTALLLHLVEQNESGREARPFRRSQPPWLVVPAILVTRCRAWGVVGDFAGGSFGVTEQRYYCSAAKA